METVAAQRARETRRRSRAGDRRRAPKRPRQAATRNRCIRGLVVYTVTRSRFVYFLYIYFWFDFGSVKGIFRKIFAGAFCDRDFLRFIYYGNRVCHGLRNSFCAK